ncbi:unnamed protein product [Rotaria sordida]|uniref:Uncharacterized protein n=1 Tax=Rotaria sordida TaxID=392033 RepID=A0A819C4Y7_9BILA|nr:unnamed protein product [Rotaria sordida]CAF3813434.1 unnamed protein product [Rotaria sordida]
MSENPDQIPPPQSVVLSSTIENNVEINQIMKFMVNTDNINKNLYQGDHDHLSQSSSTTNQGSQQNNNNNNIRSTRS